MILCRLTLNAHRDGVFGEPRLPVAAAAAAVAPEAEAEAEGTVTAGAGGTNGRSLRQTGMVNTNTFNCVGCPTGGPDSRTAVQDTSVFPFSAIGQLMGQVTSNM